MTRCIIASAMILFSFYAFSQVGINTQSPEATLDIRGKNHNGAVTATDGILVPRVNALATSGSVNGQLVYLIANTASPAFTKGFYYWNGSAWTLIGSGIFTGDTTNDAFANNGANTRVELGTESDGTSARTVGTEFVIKDNGSVGMGTTTPAAALDISSTTGGLLIPRMTTDQRNAIVSPVKGTLVYDLTLSQFYQYGTQWEPLVHVAVTSKIFQIARKNTNQSISSSATAADVSFDVVSGQGPALTISGGNIVLPAGKTYMITGWFAIGTASNYKGWIRYEIVDSNNSNSGFTVSTRGYNEPSTESTDDSPGGPAMALISTGASPMTIKMRITSKRSDAAVYSTSIADPYAETILIIQEL